MLHTIWLQKRTHKRGPEDEGGGGEGGGGRGARKGDLLLD